MSNRVGAEPGRARNLAGWDQRASDGESSERHEMAHELVLQCGTSEEIAQVLQMSPQAWEKRTQRRLARLDDLPIRSPHMMKPFNRGQLIATSGRAIAKALDLSENEIPVMGSGSTHHDLITRSEERLSDDQIGLERYNDLDHCVYLSGLTRPPWRHGDWESCFTALHLAIAEAFGIPDSVWTAKDTGPKRYQSTPPQLEAGIIFAFYEVPVTDEQGHEASFTLHITLGHNRLFFGEGDNFYLTLHPPAMRGVCMAQGRSPGESVRHYVDRTLLIPDLKSVREGCLRSIKMSVRPGRQRWYPVPDSSSKPLGEVFDWRASLAKGMEAHAAERWARQNQTATWWPSARCQVVQLFPHVSDPEFGEPTGIVGELRTMRHKLGSASPFGFQAMMAILSPFLEDALLIGPDGQPVSWRSWLKWKGRYELLDMRVFTEDTLGTTLTASIFQRNYAPGILGSCGQLLTFLSAWREKNPLAHRLLEIHEQGQTFDQVDRPRLDSMTGAILKTAGDAGRFLAWLMQPIRGDEKFQASDGDRASLSSNVLDEVLETVDLQLLQSWLQEVGCLPEGEIRTVWTAQDVDETLTHLEKVWRGEHAHWLHSPLPVPRSRLLATTAWQLQAYLMSHTQAVSAEHLCCLEAGALMLRPHQAMLKCWRARSKKMEILLEQGRSRTSQRGLVGESPGRDMAQWTRELIRSRPADLPTWLAQLNSLRHLYPEVAEIAGEFPKILLATLRASPSAAPAILREMRSLLCDLELSALPAHDLIWLLEYLHDDPRSVNLLWRALNQQHSQDAPSAAALFDLLHSSRHLSSLADQDPSMVQGVLQHLAGGDPRACQLLHRLMEARLHLIQNRNADPKWQQKIVQKALDVAQQIWLSPSTSGELARGTWDMMLQVLTGPSRSSPAQWMQLRINQILLAPEVQAGCQWPEQIPEDLKVFLNGDLSGSPRDNLDAITRRVLQSDPTLFTEWYPHFVDWAHSLARHPHPDCRSAHVHATMQRMLEIIKAMPEKACAILPMVRKLLLSSDLAGMSGALAVELLAQLGEEEECSALLWDGLVRSQPTQPELLEALQVLPSLARQDSAARGAVVERMAALVPPGMQRAMQRLLMAHLRLLRLPESGNRHQGRSVREAVEAAQTLWSSNPPISDEIAVAVWDIAVQSALSARIPSQHRWMQLLVNRGLLLPHLYAQCAWPEQAPAELRGLVTDDLPAEGQRDRAAVLLQTLIEGPLKDSPDLYSHGVHVIGMHPACRPVSLIKALCTHCRLPAEFWLPAIETLMSKWGESDRLRVQAREIAEIAAFPELMSPELEKHPEIRDQLMAVVRTFLGRVCFEQLSPIELLNLLRMPAIRDGEVSLRLRLCSLLSRAELSVDQAASLFDVMNWDPSLGVEEGIPGRLCDQICKALSQSKGKARGPQSPTKQDLSKRVLLDRPLWFSFWHEALKGNTVAPLLSRVYEEVGEQLAEQGTGQHAVALCWMVHNGLDLDKEPLAGLVNAFVFLARARWGAPAGPGTSTAPVEDLRPSPEIEELLDELWNRFMLRVAKSELPSAGQLRQLEPLLAQMVQRKEEDCFKLAEAVLKVHEGRDFPKSVCRLLDGRVSKCADPQSYHATWCARSFRMDTAGRAPAELAHSLSLLASHSLDFLEDLIFFVQRISRVDGVCHAVDWPHIRNALGRRLRRGESGASGVGAVPKQALECSEKLSRLDPVSGILLFAISGDAASSWIGGSPGKVERLQDLTSHQEALLLHLDSESASLLARELLGLAAPRKHIGWAIQFTVISLLTERLLTLGLDQLVPALRDLMSDCLRQGLSIIPRINSDFPRESRVVEYYLVTIVRQCFQKVRPELIPAGVFALLFAACQRNEQLFDEMGESMIPHCREVVSRLIPLMLKQGHPSLTTDLRAWRQFMIDVPDLESLFLRLSPELSCSVRTTIIEMGKPLTLETKATAAEWLAVEGGENSWGPEGITAEERISREYQLTHVLSLSILQILQTLRQNDPRPGCFDWIDPSLLRAWLMRFVWDARCCPPVANLPPLLEQLLPSARGKIDELQVLHHLVSLWAVATSLEKVSLAQVREGRIFPRLPESVVQVVMEVLRVDPKLNLIKGAGELWTAPVFLLPFWPSRALPSMLHALHEHGGHIITHSNHPWAVHLCYNLAGIPFTRDWQRHDGQVEEWVATVRAKVGWLLASPSRSSEIDVVLAEAGLLIHELMDYIKSPENTADLKFTYLAADRPLSKQALTYAFSFLCHRFKEMRISEMDQAPRAMHRATLALGFLIELALGHPITKASECFLGADAMLDRTMCHVIEQTRGNGLFNLSLSWVELAKDLANLAEGLIIPYMKWRISQGERLENLTLFFAKWTLNRFGDYLWTPECRPWLVNKPSNYDRCNDIVEEITAACCDAMRHEQEGHRPCSSDTHVMGGIAHHLITAREAMAKLKHMKHLKEITPDDWNPDGTHASMLKLQGAYASVLSEVHSARQQKELFLLGLFYWTLDPIGSMAMFGYLSELHLEAVHPGADEPLCDGARDSVFAVFDRIEELYDQAD
ncbi:MAG: hypothetical protein ACOYKZ_03775, partial [Chlamydiia bacterium]